MFLQSPMLDEWLGALLALERLFFRVPSNVRLPRVLVKKRLGAVLALPRSFPGMTLEVQLELGGSREDSFAGLALVGLFSGVGPHVLLQVTVLGKWLFTERAFVGFFAVVPPASVVLGLEAVPAILFNEIVKKNSKTVIFFRICRLKFHWYLRCNVRLVLWAKAEVQFSLLQMYFFLPVWVVWWFIRLALVLKFASQSWQGYGRSSECTSWWRCKSCLCLKLLSHLMHLKRRLSCSAHLW